MPHFYLHIINSNGLAKDEEGLELADLEAARAQAIKGIRSVISDEALRGLLDLRGVIKIADEGGEILDEVRFGEAMKLHLEGDEA